MSNKSNNIEQKDAQPNLSVDLGPLKLKNPLITASGTFGFGDELKDFYDPELLGAITVKGITVEPSTGNRTPRIAETAGGLLNSIGLENPGLAGFIDEKLDIIAGFDNHVLVNISGHSVDDFVRLAAGLAPYSEISALEVNISCPNIAGGGMAFGTDCNLIYEITSKVKQEYGGPVIVKLSPNVTDIVAMARAAQEAGADIISMINTLLGMAIDVEKRRPVLGNVFGGLSGPAVKPVALRMVYQVTAELDIPVIGMGGIMTGEDALEFMLAGASAVAVGTANLVNPAAPVRILEEIKRYCLRNNIANIRELIGQARS